MKKIYIVLLSFCLALPCVFLFGCGNKKDIEINFKGFKQNNTGADTCYEITVDNSVTTFDFNQCVEMKNGDSWTLSSDITGNNTIPSKMVELREQNNYYYVVVTLKKETKCYKLNVYRNAMFRVTFNTKCSQTVPSVNVEETHFIQNPNIALNRSGYEFLGWDYDFNKPIMKDTTITALYRTIPYSIDYVLDGGNNNPDNLDTYTIESLHIYLLTPTKLGYTFMGWYDQEEDGNRCYSIDMNSTGNKTFYARWSETEYLITYYLDGGINSANNIKSFTINSPDIILYNPTKYDYDFQGWYDNPQLAGNKITQINSGTARHIDLYAKWIAVPHYSITYILNNGTNSDLNPTEYCKYYEDITLEPATRSGYRFLGWYDNDDFNGNPITTIYASETEEKTLYAKWDIDLDKDIDGYYKITSKDELIQLETYASYWTSNFRLYNDIDLTTSEWGPIGTDLKSFRGNFDGNGFTISNFQINTFEHKYVGFFGYAFQSTISNLKLRDFVIDSTYEGISYFASLVAYADSCVIENCSAIGELSAEASLTTNITVGGLVATGNCEIRKCFANVDMEAFHRASGRTYNAHIVIGGLCGQAYKISDSYSLSTIYASVSNNCYRSVIDCGGLAGTLDSSGEILNCYADCEIGTTQVQSCEMLVNYTGSLIGSMPATASVEYSYSSGIISSMYTRSDNDYVSFGLLIGMIYGDGTITLPDTSFGGTNQSIVVNGYEFGLDDEYSPTAKFEDIISYIKENWSDDIWNFNDENFPTLK